MDHDMKTSRIFKTVTAFMAAAVLFVSCKKDETPAVPAQNAEDLQEVSISTDILVLEGVPEAEPSGETKSSVLTASGIESKVTGITLAAYCEGTLVAKKHYTSSLSSMVFTLTKDKTYTVYALANMGDMVSSVPSSESSMSSLEYSISSYSTVNSNGIPMAGKKEGVSVSSTSTSFSVPLTRLLAKVTANINCTWENPRIQEVRVFNMNKRLRPFGTSVAGSASDILSFQDYETATNGPTCTVTLYVPENMQGTISGIADSFHKTNDQGNATVSGKQSLLTYLQTKVSSSSLYSGDVYYRSYLGNNNTTNFDIQRNTHYVWNLTFTEEGLQHNDWKHDTDELTGVRYRYDVSPASQDLQVGQQDDWQVRKYTDTYADGSWTNGTTPNVVARSLYSYTVANPAVATVAAADANTYRTTGMSQGSTNINITVDGNSLVLPVNVTNMISYALEVESSPASASANVGQTIELRAIYYVLTNGVRDSGTDVTTDAQWSRVSGSNAISVVNAGTEKGCVTATAGGTATIRASYNSMTADKAVTFGDVYAFSVSPTNVSFRIGNTQTITPTRTLNGAASTAGTIEWTTSDANVATVSSAGVITGKGVGTATVTAVWKVNGNEVGRATVSVSVAANQYVLAVSPTTSSINVGGHSDHSVTTRTKDGAASTEGSIVWSSENTAIATVNSDGRITGVTAGTTTVRAAWKIGSATVATATVSVTVSNVVTHRIGVTASPSVTANVGETITLTAKYYTTTNGLDDDGIDITQSGDWSRLSGASSISVTNSGTKGRVTATAGGTAVIGVSYSGIYGSVSVKFNDVYGLTVTPATASVYVNATVNLQANRTFNGAASTAGTLSWSSNKTNIATVNPSTGVVTGVASGTARITATWTYNGHTESASADVTVNDVVTHRMVITAVPASATANVGETVTLTAWYYTTTNGVEDGGQDVSWLASWSRKSGASSVNVLNGSSGCIVSATDGGTAVIEATYEGTSATKSVTFNDVYSLTLAATPSNATTTCDNTIVLTPTAKKNGVVMSSPTIVWSTGNANIARVSGGTVSCWNPGTATITAQLKVGSSTVASATKDVTFTGGSYYDYYAELIYGGTNPYSNPNVLEMMAAGGNRPSYACFKLHRRNWTFANGSWSNVDTVLGCDEYNAVNPGLLSSVTKVPSLNYWQAVSRYNGSGTCTITCTVISDGQTVDIPVKVYPMEGGSSTNRELILTANNSAVASSQVGGAAIVLKAIYKVTTYTGNVQTNETLTDVTSQVSWLPQPLPTGLTIASNGNATSTAVLNNVEVYAYYPAQALNSNRVKLTFTAASQTITYVHRRLVVEGPLTVQVGSTTGDYTATLYDEKVVNGVPTGEMITVDVSNQSTIFYSENTGIATVSGRRATGVAAGSTKIYATYNDTYGGITSAQADRATLTVTAGPVTHTYALRIEPPTASIESGQTQQFKAYLVTDGNVSEKVLLSSGVLWSSSATGVATISSSGLATGQSAGTAIITAKYTPAGSSQIQATATLTVTAGGGVIIDDGWD